MKITKQQLKEMGACKDGLRRFIKQTNGTLEPVDVSDLVGGLNTYGDLLWLAGKTIQEERVIRFACECALLNFDKIKLYTDRYDELLEFLKNPTYTNTNSAKDAFACYSYAYAAADAASNGAESRGAVDKLLIDMFNEF